MKKDAVGNNPLANLIPRGPAPRPMTPPAPGVTPVQALASPPASPPANPLATSLPAPAAPRTLPVASSPASVPAPLALATTPRSAGAPQVAAAEPAPASVQAPEAASQALALKRCTVRLPVALLERMTSAIVHTPGMTQADFVHDAITTHLDALERARGSAFPAYGKRLRPGRKSW